LGVNTILSVIEQDTIRACTGPQEWFLESDAHEAGYGGSAFCGKTFILMLDVLRQIDHPLYYAILFRRIEDELHEMIRYARDIFPNVGGVEKESGLLWTFPSGAQVELSSMHLSADWTKYHGRNITYIGYDELVTFTQEQYLSLMVWNRVTTDDLTPYIRWTSNPWPDDRGDGIGWIMDRFTIPYGIPPKEPIVTFTSDHYREFIPATYEDNKEVPEQEQARWLASLEQALDPDKFKAYIEGVWGISPGLFFSSFSKHVHVKSPGWIEERLARDNMREAAGFDYGGTSPTCLIKASQDTERKVYVTDEYYVPAKPIKHHGPLIAEIADGCRIYADPSIFYPDSKKTEYATTTIEQAYRPWVRFIRGKNRKLDGYMAITEPMRITKGQEEPDLFISTSCVNLIRELLTAMQHPKKPDLIANDGSFHAIAAFRYLMMYIRKPSYIDAAEDNTGTAGYYMDRLTKKRPKSIYARG